MNLYKMFHREKGHVEADIARLILIYRHIVKEKEKRLMEMNEKLVRELKQKLEVEINKKEIEIVEYWKNELESL